MKNKTIIFLAALAAMFGVTTPVQAYTEYWGNGTFFDADEVIYDGFVYTLVSYEGHTGDYLEDTTSGTVDVFNGDHLEWKASYVAYIFEPNWAHIDTLIFTGADYDEHSKVYGEKPTGTSGEKSGTLYWSAYVRHVIGSRTTEYFYATGVWDAYFNYNALPLPTATGDAWITSPENLEGSGSGSMQRIYYE